MEKKRIHPQGKSQMDYVLILRTMKLITLFLFVSILQLSAASYSQTTKLKLSEQNQTLGEVLNKIEKQSQFSFFYDANQIDLNRKITIEADNLLIDQVLDEVLAGTGLTYSVNNKLIVIHRMNGSTEPVPAQQPARKQITGKITDAAGVSLPGVSVIVKGTTIGVITDSNGKYSLQNIPENANLQFSFVGMKTIEIHSVGKTTINVTLEDETVGIEEVIAVGYGVQKKVNVVGSIAQISNAQIENRPIPNLSNGLAGTLPGVTVTQSTGKPGAGGTTISVRGVGSFGATPDALILVDGIPGTMNDLNTQDVESISVLKDASTAAIYGARAANGVILITTKKGKAGKTRISYSGYVGWQSPTEFPSRVNSGEYAQLMNVANPNTYTDAQVASYKAGNDLENYPNTDFLKAVFSRNGIQTAHDLSLVGGTEKSKYFVSFGYLNQQGLVEKNYYERYNARVNLTTQLFDKLTLSASLSGSSENRNEPQANAGVDMGALEGIVTYSVRMPGIYVGKYSNGTYGLGNQVVGTPISWLESASYVQTPSYRFNNNFKLDWKVLQGLTLTAIAGYNFQIDNSSSYRASQVLNPTVAVTSSFLNQSRNQSQYKTIQALADYSKTIGNHNLSLLLGYSFESQNISYFSGYRESFPSNDYSSMSMGGTSNQVSNGYTAGWALQSYFGRFKYDFKQKYLFEATVRYDGSSRFPSGQKFGTFPSLAGGWRVSEEPFFQPLKKVISSMKLKTSWGILGNQNISNYPYQSTLTSGLNYPIGGALSNGAGITVLTDPNIHWESTKTVDGGLELSFFKGAINMDVSYFLKNTYDILYQPSSSVSNVLGMGLSQMNMGKLRNSGIELQLSHQKTIGKFNYMVTGIFTLINNEVTSLGIGGVQQLSGMVGNGSNLFVGYPMQMYYGYVTDGVFLNTAEVASWPNQTKVNPSSQAGDFRYKDLNNDGKVDQADMKYLGSSIPKYNYSLNLEVGYSGIDVKAFFQGVADVSGNLTSYAGWAFYNLGTVQRWQADGHFDPANPVRYPAYPRFQAFSNTTPPNYVLSDYWVLNAAYTRLKNLQIGYTLPKSIIGKSGIEKVRIYFSGDNLFTYKKYRQGWDPEISTGGGYYPILATYSFGVNLNF